MFKKLCFLLMLMLFLPTVQNLAVVEDKNEFELYEISGDEASIVNYHVDSDNHVVLAEIVSATWCSDSPAASETMRAIFPSSSYPFYYLTLVQDENDMARKRIREFNPILTHFPTLYFDGGYTALQGSSEFDYINVIQETSERETHAITMDINAQWIGENIDISLDVTNEDSSPYLGHLRICILEKNSRWTDNDGKNYNYALMDYALNMCLDRVETISLWKQNGTITMEWKAIIR